MNFSISFEHYRTTFNYLVKVERDDIFIAIPKAKNKHTEKIFLTKSNGQWVGDCENKTLLKKIGEEIDATYKAKKEKSKAA